MATAMTINIRKDVKMTFLIVANYFCTENEIPVQRVLSPFYAWDILLLLAQAPDKNDNDVYRPFRKTQAT